MGGTSDMDGFARRWWPALVRSAVFLGASPTEAEDIAQTALIRCFRSWRNVDLASDQDAYVYRVLLNCFIKSRKRRWWGEIPASDEELASHYPPASDISEQAVVKDTLLNALASLPENQRSVVVLRYYCDLSERQVADTLRVPLGTVKSRASRAIEHLAAELDTAKMTDNARERRS